MYLQVTLRVFGGWEDDPIRFVSVVMKHLVMTYIHCIKAIRCFHCICSINDTDAKACFKLIEMHRAHLKQKQSDGDKNDIIKIPMPKAHSNKIAY